MTADSLYVGIMTPGTTSRMRADTLVRVTNSSWTFVDTDAPFLAGNRLWRTTAFRWKIGPIVRRINQCVLAAVASGATYDAVWVDKGVYLWPRTVKRLRSHAKTLIYYTPDTSFFANRSRFFNASMHLYDRVVTTKSFELDHFLARLPQDRVDLTTQAFDPRLHRPRPAGQAVAKRDDVVFIGLCEPDRQRAIATLLAASIPVRIGGRGWDRFRSQYASHPRFTFIAESVFGNDYVEAYRSASVGLGLLSKRFPELHTTRTFEIPACGTVLATERNADTERFFKPDDVLFFDSYGDLATKLKAMLTRPASVDDIAKRGYQRVVSGGFTYDEVVGKVIDNALTSVV